MKKMQNCLVLNRNQWMNVIEFVDYHHDCYRYWTCLNEFFVHKFVDCLTVFRLNIFHVQFQMEHYCYLQLCPSSILHFLMASFQFFFLFLTVFVLEFVVLVALYFHLFLLFLCLLLLFRFLDLFLEAKNYVKKISLGIMKEETLLFCLLDLPVKVF